MIHWTSVAAVLLAAAVMLGAFGAHGLRDRLDAYSMGVYEKAVFYHFIHAIGLLVVSTFPRIGLLPAESAGRICWLLLSGIFLFSGSLYVLAISGVRTLGAVTPFGGVAFIAAWLLLAYAMLQSR